MNKQVTFGHILTLLMVIIIPLIVWGTNVERRFEKLLNNTYTNTKDIDYIINDNREIRIIMYENHKEIMKEFTDVKLELADKKNRE